MALVRPTLICVKCVILYLSVVYIHIIFNQKVTMIRNFVLSVCNPGILNSETTQQVLNFEEMCTSGPTHSSLICLPNYEYNPLYLLLEDVKDILAHILSIKSLYNAFV